MNNNQNENIKIDDEISLKELFSKAKEILLFFKTKWLTFFLIGAFGGILGFTIAFFQKPTYTAALTFAMEEDKGVGGGGLSGALGLASSFGIDLGGGGGGGAFAASNLSELMKSRLLVDKVLLKPIEINGKITTLAEYFIQINDLRKGWQSRPLLRELHFQPLDDRSKFTFQKDSILQQIHKILINKDLLSIMQKDKKVTILTIEVTNENEFFAKTFCENIAFETSDFYIKTKNKKSRINVDVLQKQVDSIRNQLNDAIKGVASEADNVYNLNPAIKLKEVASKKRQIDVQANTVILTNLAVQLELAKITLRKETPLIQLIDQPRFPLEKLKKSKLKALISGGLIAEVTTLFFFTLLFYIRKKLE